MGASGGAAPAQRPSPAPDLAAPSEQPCLEGFLVATLGLRRLRALRAKLAASEEFLVATQQAPSSPEFPRRVASCDDVRLALP